MPRVTIPTLERISSMEEVVAQVEADTAICKASAIANKANRETQALDPQSKIFFEGTGPAGMVQGPAGRYHTTGRPSVEAFGGDSSAPFVFTKLLRPVLTRVREQGIRCLIYLDDLLIWGRTKEELKCNYQKCCVLLMLNEEKSIHGPTQQIEFLGFLINMTLSVTPEKLLYPMQVDTEKLRHYDLIQTSNSPSTSALQRTTGVKKRLSEPPPLIRCYGTSGSENEEGPGVVDKSITPLELQTNLTKTTLSDSGVRCIKPGMGSNKIEPQRFYKRSMEFPRTTPPHKFQGITSCMVCNSINAKGHTY